MTPDALRDLVVDVLEEYKATDIVALKVTDVTVITDYMVIASGTSSRHVGSLADRLVQEAKERRLDINGVEGQQSAEWVLLDLGDVLVHLMQRETRSFYDLERLWGDLPTDTETQV
ncbi:MAG: ribosome silencing factor [Pseudomonadota bacterium]